MSTECQYLGIGDALDVARKEAQDRLLAIRLMLDGIARDPYTTSSTNLAYRNGALVNEAVSCLRAMTLPRDTDASAEVESALYDVLSALDGLYTTMRNPAIYMYTEQDPQPPVTP